MRLFIVSLIMLLCCTAIYGQETPSTKGEDIIVVADQLYWWEKEGNLGISVGGKFNSMEQMAQTLDLMKDIGVFHSRTWKLHEILVSTDFNANGDVADWIVSGPKPLILDYVKGLESAYKNRSLFYDFGYRIVNCKPTAYFENDGTFPDYED
jgi:hypothetical protein